MRFFSRGKLLISGEYLVLKGALALAVPLEKGQDLSVNASDNPGTLEWESREYGKTWFTASFRMPFFEILETSDEPTAQNLLRHFRAMLEMKPEFAGSMSGVNVVADLDFNRQWGFGSSSSLVSNLAWWAEIDPFRLHRKVSSGSGYDVVCSREEGPVFFWLERQKYGKEEVDLAEHITPYIYFVYLGKKEDSSKHVADFLARKKAYRVEKRLVSELGRHMANAGNIQDFGFYMKEHEQVVSSILKTPSIREGIFSDLAGEAKSMGAWGGDFAMITWTGSPEELADYLATKKLRTFFTFNELVKTR